MHACRPRFSSGSCAALFLALSCFAPVHSGVIGPGTFATVPIFNQNPLEAKLGPFSDGPGPDGLAMVLWSDGANNRLDAIRIPPPYDGTGITATPLENTATLFALGDICTVGNNVVVPYIKDFNVEVARFDGNNWTTSTIPGTVTNNFDSADCATTDNGIFISGHDLTDNENEIFRSTKGGDEYTFYGRYGNASGPFGGGVREALVSDQSRYLASLHQTPGGVIRVAQIDTSQSTPAPAFTDITTLPAPGGFTFVKESAGRSGSGGLFFFTYNADGSARTVDFSRSNPGGFTQRNLGPVSNANPFGFQGGTLVYVEDEDGTPVQNNVLWGDYFFYDPTSPGTPASTVPSYPASGNGGPVAGCRVDQSDGFLRAFFLVPRGAPKIGTDLLRQDFETFDLFADGFESGDTSAWSQCN